MGEGDNRGWDGWMASPTRCTWVWVNSGSWWWTGRPGELQSMGSQRVRHDWATELTNWLKWVERASPVVHTVKNSLAVKETQVWSLGSEYPLEEGMAPYSSILARRMPMDKGAWWATVHGVAKSQTWLKRLTMHTHTADQREIYNEVQKINAYQ